MDDKLLQKLLAVQVSAGKPVEISVVGVSMNPTLYEGDSITVQRQAEYEIGDILVFTYKHDELLVHRLLEKRDGLYFCKGDNAFRLEDVPYERIIGKVTAVNGRSLPPCAPRLITLSMLVNRAFFRCRYDAEKTKQSSIYQLYQKVILRKEENIMVYQKNKSMEYIQRDETSLAVFDPESGDTHFFDEIGIDILGMLEEPCDLETLLQKLCAVYETSPDEIREDVEEFLQDTVSKKVVEVL